VISELDRFVTIRSIVAQGRPGHPEKGGAKRRRASPPPSNHLVSSAGSVLLKGPACRTQRCGFKLCTIELVALDQGRRVRDSFSNLCAAEGRGSASLRKPDTHIRARQLGDSVPRAEHSFEDLRSCTSPGGQRKAKGGRA